MLRSGRSAHNTPWKPTSRRRTYWQNILANVHPAVRPTDDDVLQVLNGFLFKSRALQAFQGPPASTLEADETDVPKPVSLIGMLSMEVLDTMAAAQAAEERAAKFKKAHIGFTLRGNTATSPQTHTYTSLKVIQSFSLLS